jgi:hypothetical protein
MRFHTFLFTMLLLAAVTSTPYSQSNSQAVGRTQVLAPVPASAATDSVVEFLIASAAADFHEHGPSGPLRFREVRLGHVPTPGAETLYLLCGKFMQTQGGVNAPWTPFVTIKTSGYEQWIGLQAAAFCQDSSVVWDSMGDLSSLLQGRLDTFR